MTLKPFSPLEPVYECVVCHTLSSVSNKCKPCTLMGGLNTAMRHQLSLQEHMDIQWEALKLLQDIVSGFGYLLEKYLKNRKGK